MILDTNPRPRPRLRELLESIMARGNGTTAKSPFFHPSTPRKKGALIPVRSPGGTTRLQKQPPDDDEEHKATVLGTVFNFVNQIVGCGIVGIPFAVRESGLVAGVVLVVLSAVLTEKSLRILLDAARYIQVPSYEMLCEATFGRTGFLLVSIAMFVLAYGSMISYLIVVKDTLPPLLGVSPDDGTTTGAVLVASSALVMLPISSQRDMADLAKTSAVSVCFDVLLVAIVAFKSPIGSRTIDDEMGQAGDAPSSIVRWDTLFVGLGVLSFAFVCQHSGFIIAGSLRNPTRKRVRIVTLCALGTCALLATVMGVSGYLGFGDATEGNVLNNFGRSSGVAGVARGLLCTTMFFVYPMESFVARHIAVVLLFKGRSAHKGSDHVVLARTDRRIVLTVALYLSALVPALVFEDLGTVLALTGALGGSSLSYVGPGLTFLGVHGGQFLALVEESWGRRWGGAEATTTTTAPRDENGTPMIGDGVVVVRNEGIDEARRRSPIAEFCANLGWYVLLMPLWCSVASAGEDCLAAFEKEEVEKSPHYRGRKLQMKVVPPSRTDERVAAWKDGEEDDQKPLIRTLSAGAQPISAMPGNAGGAPPPMTAAYGAAAATPAAKKGTVDRVIAAAIASENRQERETQQRRAEEAENDDNVDGVPAWSDFLIAIGYFIFGMVAVVAGVLSTFI